MLPTTFAPSIPNGFNVSKFLWDDVVQATLTSGNGHVQSCPDPKKMRLQFTEELLPSLHP